MSFERTNLRGWFRLAAFVVLNAALVLFAAPIAHGQERSVSIGYMPVPGPWLAAAGNGTIERETGYTIKWVRFDSGAQAVQALHDGQVQIAFAGSVPIAVGMSGGADIELFWIAAGIDYAEGLIVRNQSKIVEPQHLRGKRIGTPFWSTAHFHLLFALEQFKLTEDHVDIYNMTPDEIITNWKIGGIDAAFIWYPTLDKLKLDGKVLAWSGWLNRWGRATFDGLVAHRPWSAAHPEFMAKFVNSINAANANHRATPARWSAASSEIRTIAKMVGGQSNISPMLAILILPDINEQVSPDWLGGGRDGTAAVSLRETALFLERYGMIKKPLADYSGLVSPKWAQAALAEQQKRMRANPEVMRQ